PVVVEQGALAGVKAQTRDEQIYEPVVVIIAGGNVEGVDALIQARADRDVRERAIPVVAVQAASAVRAGDGDIQESIVVVIEDGRAAPPTGLVQPELFGDIFESHAGGIVSGLHIHAVFGGDTRRFSAH